ncbi:MAG: hypothetical protein JNJ54_34300 [Myxococcaceae bacterium]|nr:hypothetical protein [Myxococcaceae bacterium]
MSTKLSTPTRFLPSSAQHRLALLCEAARADEALGLLQSAETNLRLALCFVPDHAETLAALERLVAARDRLRRSTSI